MENEFGFFKNRLQKWREGWERVFNVFNDPMSMELILTKRAVIVAAMLGLFFGGTRTFAESKRRFELYKLDKDFGAFTFRRRYDYYLTRFFIYGVKKAIPLSIAMGSIVALTFTITAYRDRYSIVYFPLCAYSVFAFSVFINGLGVYSLMGSVPAVLIPSALLSAVTVGGCYWAGCNTVDDAYRQFRKKFCAEIEEKSNNRTQKRRYLISRKYIFFSPGVKRQMEKEIAEGTWCPTALDGCNEIVTFAANQQKMDECDIFDDELLENDEKQRIDREKHQPSNIDSPEEMPKLRQKRERIKR